MRKSEVKTWNGPYHCVKCGHEWSKVFSAHWNYDLGKSSRVLHCPNCNSSSITINGVKLNSGAAFKMGLENPPEYPPEFQKMVDVSDVIEPRSSTLTIEPPPSAPPQNVREEPITNDTIDEEALSDARAEGGMVSSLASIAKEGALTPEELTPEECADICSALYEIEGLGLAGVGFKTPDLEPERAERAGRALARIFKRHPEWVKGKVADLLDGAIIFSLLGAPLITFAGVKVKEFLAKRKSKKEAEYLPEKAEKERADNTPPPSEELQHAA